MWSSIFFIETDVNNCFKNFFMTLSGPWIQRFISSMRHLIYIYGTSTKAKYKDMLIVSANQYANILNLFSYT